MERNQDTNIESGYEAVIDEMNKEAIQSGKKSKKLNNDPDDDATDGGIPEPTQLNFHRSWQILSFEFAI